MPQKWYTSVPGMLRIHKRARDVARWIQGSYLHERCEFFEELLPLELPLLLPEEHRHLGVAGVSQGCYRMRQGCDRRSAITVVRALH
jgi:hypothetical protein